MQDRFTPPALRNRIKIELFDALSKKKIHEVSAHNLVTNYGQERYERLCALGILGQTGVNCYVSDINAKDDYNFGFLRSLILTDSQAAPAVTDFVIPGTLTGYATREPYPGTTATRGAINVNESIGGHESLKFVADFATDKGNGTHKSVFWSDQLPGSLGWWMRPLYNSYRLARSYNYFVEADDGYFYGTSGSTLYKIDKTTLAELSTYALSGTPYSSGAIFDVYDGACYYQTASNSTLYKYVMSTGVTTTISIPWSPNGDAGCIIGGYLYYSYNYNPTGMVARVKLSDATYDYKTVSSQNLTFTMRRSGSLLYAMTNSGVMYLYDFSANTFTLQPCGAGGVNTYSLADGEMYYKGYVSSYYWAGSTNYTRVDWYTVFLVGATKGRANMITGLLLPEPIVKTSAQTMKVTYTIEYS